MYTEQKQRPEAKEFFRGTLGVCISDLFFNSEQVSNASLETVNGADLESTQALAKEWLEMYSYFKQFTTAEDLALNFLARV